MPRSSPTSRSDLIGPTSTSDSSAQELGKGGAESLPRFPRFWGRIGVDSSKEERGNIRLDVSQPIGAEMVAFGGLINYGPSPCSPLELLHWSPRSPGSPPAASMVAQPITCAKNSTWTSRTPGCKANTPGWATRAMATWGQATPGPSNVGSSNSGLANVGNGNSGTGNVGNGNSVVAATPGWATPVAGNVGVGNSGGIPLHRRHDASGHGFSRAPHGDRLSLPPCRSARCPSHGKQDRGSPHPGDGPHHGRRGHGPFGQPAPSRHGCYDGRGTVAAVGRRGTPFDGPGQGRDASGLVNGGRASAQVVTNPGRRLGRLLGHCRRWHRLAFSFRPQTRLKAS